MDIEGALIEKSVLFYAINIKLVILKLEKEVLIDKLFNLELEGEIIQQNGQYF